MPEQMTLFKGTKTIAVSVINPSPLKMQVFTLDLENQTYTMPYDGACPTIGG